jgi:adenylyl cyclase-associated protein
LVAEKLEALSFQNKKSGGDKKADSEDPPSVVDFDGVLNGPVKDFVTAAKNLGGDIAKLGELSEKGFAQLRSFVVAASKCAKPTEDELNKKFSEVTPVLQAVVPDNRNKVAFFHQSAFAEHIQILQWILVTPAPKPFISGTVEAADFYLNKILTSTKDDPLKNDHRAFVKAIKDITSELGDYVKKYHTTGLNWKANGTKFSEFK